jgi:hypothetical protein
MSGHVIGFTGTRNGMSIRQRMEIWRLMGTSDATELHHGDCVGADAQAHDIGVEFAWRVDVHPPSDDRLRAFCEPANGGIMHDPKPYHERNADIVAACDILFAAPSRSAKGGTWWTIGHAEEIGRPVVIVRADGSTEERMP